MIYILHSLQKQSRVNNAVQAKNIQNSGKFSKDSEGQKRQFENGTWMEINCEIWAVQQLFFSRLRS